MTGPRMPLTMKDALAALAVAERENQKLRRRVGRLRSIIRDLWFGATDADIQDRAGLEGIKLE